ncbi:DUF4118 domain-containing protein [Alicyclobacillus sp. SO9]|uniref:ATP-binding protein n=1 Tax=Alicyclobacillus sp. SO9 TaxID=2665646 RepID=UPI0018E8BBA9|nr:DUF4118 domain-containing protein [Alicyclobacillus sp. SO9]QQE77096.1 DUF4118 domain-containing protein [Alicyclobacillus sp. SO9]
MKTTTFQRPKWRILSYLISFPTPEDTFHGSEKQKAKLLPYVITTLVVFGLTMILSEIGHFFTLVNIALLYLLPVLITAVRWGLWTSFYAASIGVVAFDFFFVPPLYTYTVSDARYLISFAVYLAVATFTATLASQLRQDFREARERAAVTSALFLLSTQVAASGNLDSILAAIVRQAFGTFGLCATVLLPNAKGQLNARASDGFHDANTFERVAPRIVQWVYNHGELAGRGTDTDGSAPIVYVPLKTETKVHGVMCFLDKHPGTTRAISNTSHVIDALAGLAAVSIARVRFEEEAQIAHLTAESEHIRTVLLDSISHELRTPLATIIGSATSLIENKTVLSTTAQDELLGTVLEGSMRMNRLVTNLLGMVRLESGMLQLNKSWCDVADIVGVALRQTQDALNAREVTVQIPEDLPVISVDELLLEQVLVNLLSNANKYSPEGSPIEIEIKEDHGVISLSVQDWGDGISPDDAEKIFDKFYRSSTQRSIPGTGLGLAICKGIIQAHGGKIFARNRVESGLAVTIELRVCEEQPSNINL